MESNLGQIKKQQQQQQQQRKNGFSIVYKIGTWDGEDSSEQAVEPELGVSEEDEGDLPDAVEALGAGRLGQNVVKRQLKKL